MGEVKIQLTETAYNDLEEIENYISGDSQIIARKFISRIFDKIEQLNEFPKSGKPVPELNNLQIRELLLNKYRIIYQIENEDLISVLRVVHGSRLLDIEI